MIKRNNLKTSIVAALVWAIGPAVALSNNFEDRCSNDQLVSMNDGVGRNQWAVKCGYISQNKADKQHLAKLFV